ncbi:MAG: tetratricopeptide (TPR) repeat protein [Flavobacteriales bacterium]|jgi:tetratricopeptide (TPR) repeat protein
MKQTIYLIILILITVSCSNETEEKQQEIDQEWSKYNNAMNVNDYQVAKSIVYDIIALDSNNHSYYDTLAKLYYITREYKSAEKCATKALAFGVNEPTLNIAYSCAKALKKNENVLLYGTELMELHPDSLSLMYELAFNDIQLQYLESAEEILNKIIVSPKSLTELYSEYRGNGVQKVAYRATCYNLLGFIYNEKLEKENALKMFNAAIMVQEDYVLAKENLDILTLEMNTADSIN